jgi:hypothetical protein
MIDISVNVFIHQIVLSPGTYRLQIQRELLDLRRMRLTLIRARAPWDRSRWLAKAELSRSKLNADSAKESRGEAKSGVVMETWI